MPSRRRTLVESVVARLREEIATAGLVAGARMPAEAVLAERFGVSRSTVREAVKLLEYSGVLEVRHGDGTFVRGSDELDMGLDRALTGHTLPELLDLSRALEWHGTVTVLAQRDPHTISLLSRLATRVATSPATPDLRAEEAFHRALCSCAGNPLITTLERHVRHAIRSVCTASPAAGVPACWAEPELHRALVGTIQAGNRTAAEEMIARLLSDRRMGPTPHR